MESSFSHCGKFLSACCGLVNEDPIRATDSLARHPFRAPVASEPCGSSGSTSHSKSWKHDVFLSFRGEDTRKTIISHLFSLLEERGVNVFIDTNGLEKGGDISSQLIDTIRSSRISVVIFSHDYAGSRWCLQELVEIMECKNKSQGQIVLPVFYDVVPSDVRNQRGDFGKAFAKHKHSKNVAQWRAALTEAGSLTGWDMTNSANGSEAEIVRKIARAISNKLNSTYLDVPKYSVGLERRMMRVNEHMSDGSNDVRFVVISGIGGVGKTTLAKAVYNQFANTFEANCFLANIGENSKQPNGLVHLQEQLLKDVLQYEGNLGSVDRGSNVIKERVSSRRVLVILDNLTHRDQRKALAREREWFGPGSRIIITTRNLDMMKEIIKADFVYTLEGLDDDESLQLFSMHAFGSSRPKEGFMELSKRVVCYCEGLPLALEVLGASLLDQSVEEWESEISKLKQIPHDDIQSGIPPRAISRVDTLPVEIFNTDKLESTSVPDKLEKSKTAKQRPHNVLGEEATRIFDNNIPVQQKLQLLNRIATVKDDGTVEFEVPVDAEPHYPGVKPKDMDNEVVDNETLDATDLQYIPPLQIVMLIVGTRGDVQPFVAIGKRLQDYGHRVRLATHSNFKEFVLTAGLEFYPLGGDPKVLAGYMVKNKGFLPSGPSEIPIQRNQIKEIINSLQAACKDPDVDSGIPFKADAIIANPPAYGHTHVAEALKVPLHIFSTMPWTPTSEFPHPLSRVKQQAGYRLSYQLVDSSIWLGIRDMINDTRKKKLKLRPVTYLSGSQGSDSDVPYGYIWSPHLVPKPKDWGPKVDVVGFCFLDLASNYEPPEELVKWLQAGEKPIYIGFGSLPVVEPEKMTQVIVDALETTGQRGIINKGWGGLGNLAEPKESIYLLDNIPHDWLFLQCKAVVHHGGAGTTAAGLRAAVMAS